MAGAAKWGRRLACLLAMSAVGACYWWEVRAAGYRFQWGRDLGGYYDLLARGFASGHLFVPIDPSPELLRMPNPWDPAIDEKYKMHDMALFRGHYYLYFGAAPALLFLPWRLATAHDLPENFALFLLCFGGFLFASTALLRLLDLARVRPRWPLLAMMLLALGICQSVPYLLNRVWVYEIAIGSGYCFVSGAVFCLARAIRSRQETIWLGACGLMFGLAMASRPHLALAGAVAAVLLAKRKGLQSRPMAAFAAGFLAICLAVGVYNFERFDNPFEFGFRYQLSGPGQNRIDLAPRNLAPGAFYMLFCPPDFSPVFPWVRMVLRHPDALGGPIPSDYFAEATAGALWIAPFLIGAAFLARRRRKAEDDAQASVVLRTVSVSAAMLVLFLISTHLATQRYEVDFLPLAVLAALAHFAIRQARLAGFARAAITALFAVAVAYSMVVNLALGFAGPYDEMLNNRPAGYVRIARWFSPIAEFRPMLDPWILIEMDTGFSPQPDGFREPLVTSGGSRHCWSLCVEHRPGRLRLVSRADDSEASFDFAAAAARLRVTYSPETRIMAVAMDGRRVLEHRVETLVTAPAQLLIGESRLDPEWAGTSFRGRIQVLRKLVSEREPVL